MRRRMLFAGLVLAILLVAWIAYRLANREAFVARGALSPPPSEQITFAGSTPAHPFHLEAGNVLLRTVFRTAAPANSQVEVRDILRFMRERPSYYATKQVNGSTPALCGPFSAARC